MTADRRGFLWVGAICVAAGLACAGSCAAYAQDDPNAGLLFASEGEWLILESKPFDWTNVLISDGMRGASCKLYELIEASGALREFLPIPTGGDVISVPAIYVPPLSQADQLRADADRIERRDVAIQRWLKALAECEAVVGIGK